MARRVRRACGGLAVALALLGGCHADTASAPPAANDLAPSESAPTPSTLPASPEPEKPATDSRADVLIPRDWLLLATIDARGRRPFRPDAVFAKHLLAPDAPPPVAGESLTGETGTASWLATRANDSGAPDLAPLKDAEAGWAWTSVDAAEPRAMLLAATGVAQAFVNGVPVAGDPYGIGLPPMPVALRAGRNEIALAGLRGSPSVRLLAPPAPLFVAPGDVTAPDLEVGMRPAPGTSAAVLVVNASLDAVPQLRLGSGGALPDGTATPFAEIAPETQLSLPPLSVLKLPVPILWSEDAAPPAAVGELHLPLRVGGLPGVPDQRSSIRLMVRAEGGQARNTYVSLVDRSVQEFTLRPPANVGAEGAARPGLLLTLHGAGVDSWAQAGSYSPKPDLWICAPTNRRPYGFDWQDWGRRDAYDAMSEAMVRTGADPSRVMLSGHSMGGHGTWFLAANDPDRFAAIAPSAGWRSFDTYGSRPAGALSALWRGADLAGDVPALIGNLAPQPTFILHGTADDNVPISEAQAMEAALRAAGGAPQFHWQQGAGHWWDGDEAPGVDCVDWPGIFELFASARRPAEPDVIDVTIADPWQDARHYWFVALQPLRYGEALHVSGERRAADDAIELVTSNVRRCAVFWKDRKAPAKLIVDGQTIEGAAWPKGSRFGLLLFADGAWKTSAEQGPPPHEKTPDRSGPFKRAFDNGFLLVYGTAGTPEENAALLASARADAEEWWYRGNGCAPLLADKEFLRLDATPEFAGRNVVLYGNADSNAAWSRLLPAECPVTAHRGELRLGEHAWQGEDLGAVFVWPREGTLTTLTTLVGAFADSGAAGTRLVTTLAPFTSGIGYPDYALFSAKVLQQGDGGVLAAGWFGPAWTLDESQPHGP